MIPFTMRLMCESFPTHTPLLVATHKNQAYNSHHESPCWLDPLRCATFVSPEQWLGIPPHSPTPYPHVCKSGLLATLFRTPGKSLIVGTSQLAVALTVSGEAFTICLCQSHRCLRCFTNPCWGYVGDSMLCYSMPSVSLTLRVARPVGSRIGH